MADFDPAFDRTVMGKEGGGLRSLGYADRRDDLGGETVIGISRIWHPAWPGWGIIERQKKRPGFPENLSEYATTLFSLARPLYKREYWDRVRGDEVPYQLIAEKLFDIAVLKDSADATRYLQRLLNVFNRRGRLYPDINVDGGFGPITLKTLGSYLEKRAPGRLLAYLNALLGEGLVSLAERIESQEENVYGWGARLWAE